MARDVEIEPKVERGAGPVERTREEHADEGDSERGKPVRRSFLREHPLGVLLGAIAIVALAVGGFLWWRYSSTYESTDDAQIDGYIYPVSARVGGRVIAVKVEDNQVVQAGQLLAQLDPADYQVALERAQAELAQARANTQAAVAQVPITTTSTASQTSTFQAGVEEAAQGVSVAQQQYQAALAKIRESQANADKAQKDVERYRPLAEKQEISQQQFDQAVANAQAMAAVVETNKANADAAARQVSQERARVAQARAQQQATNSYPQEIAAQRARAASSRAAAMGSKAAVDQAQLNLGYANIMAPVTGVAGKRAVQVGQQVQPGQELLSIVPLENLWVTANLKETQLRKMRVGQGAEIKVDATGRKYKAHVDSFPGATGARYSLLPPENASGNYVKVVQRLPVKLVFDKGEDSEHLLRPGMSVAAKVWVK
jgi:membrane fusion protein (multidrug efflux system)